MTTRTTRTSVTFAHPFSLAGIEGTQTAGTFAVETDEETIDALSFVAWRRVATWIHLARHGTVEVHAVDAADLEAALANDVRAGAGPS